MQAKYDSINALFEHLEAPWLVTYQGIEIIEFQPGPEGYVELTEGYCVPMDMIREPDLAIVHEHFVDTN